MNSQNKTNLNLIHYHCSTQNLKFKINCYVLLGIFFTVNKNIESCMFLQL